MLKIVKYISILFFVLVVTFGVFLFLGIKVDSFSFGNFSVSKLYIKYDKKLIVEIEKLDFLVKNSKNNKSIDYKSIYENLSRIPIILNNFQKIDVERLKIGNREFTLTVNENYLYLDNNEINLASSLSTAGSQIILDINSLFFKKNGMTFFGKAKIDTFKQLINFFGSYDYKYVTGELNLQLKDEIIDFYVNTNKSIKTISFLKDFFRLDKVAESWMYDNVEGDISLNYLYGKFDLNKLRLIEKSTLGNAVITDAKIHFNKKVKPVKTSKLTIDFKHDNLYFKLLKPTYAQTSLDGSKVYINNLTSLKNGVVVVDLKTNSRLNNNILEILDAYKIKLPIKQIDGNTTSSLVLKIPYSIKRHMEVDGKFDIEKSNLKLNNFDFFTQEAQVILKDNIIHIEKSKISNDMFDINLNLKIDTKTHQAIGQSTINKFEIKTSKGSVIKLNDFDTKVDVDFNDTTKINLKNLQTLIEIDADKTNITISDLKPIYEYSELLKNIKVDSGNLDIKVFDKDNITFNALLQNLDFPIFKDGNKIQNLSLKGDISKEKTHIYTESKEIQIESFKDEKDIIKLDNIDIKLSQKEQKENNYLPNINIELNNSKVMLDDNHTYRVNWAKIKIDNKKINFSADVKDLDLPISKNNKKITNLTLDGVYEKNNIKLKTFDKKLNLEYDLNKEKIIMNLEGYDVLYYTKNQNNEENLTSYYINGKNSNIIINDKYKAISDKYNFIFENTQTKIDLSHKSTKVKYFKNEKGEVIISGKNMNDQFLNALIGKKLVEGGNINIEAKGINDIIKGKAIIEDSKIVDLAILNNLLILINTSPGLINPLLAIPSVVGMATNDGFNLNGYRIVNGTIDFVYDVNNKFLNMEKIFTKGNGIDFDGFMTINFNTFDIDSKLKLVFFKNYSKIVGAIPVVNYILLGDENRVSTQVEIYGTLEEPKYKTKFVKEGVTAPLNLIKRIITSPLKLFETTEDKK